MCKSTLIQACASFSGKIDISRNVGVDQADFTLVLARLHALRKISRALGCGNGRHVRWRGVCRKAWGFKSPPEHDLRWPLSGIAPASSTRSSVIFHRTSRLFSLVRVQSLDAMKNRHLPEARMALKLLHIEATQDGVSDYIFLYLRA